MNRGVCEHNVWVEQKCEDCIKETIQRQSYLELEAEVDRLKKEVEELHRDGLTIYGMMNDSRVDALRAENVMMREAIKAHLQELYYSVDEAPSKGGSDDSLQTILNSTPETAKITAVLDAAKYWYKTFRGDDASLKLIKAIRKLRREKR